MGKYSTILDKLWRLTFGIFTILVGVGAIGLSIWGVFAISNVFFILVLGMLFGVHVQNDQIFASASVALLSLAPSHKGKVLGTDCHTT